MILLLDAGNSRIKWGCLSGNTLGNKGVAAHSTKGLRSAVKSEWKTLPRPERVIASNVAGEPFSRELTGWIRATWDRDVEFIQPQRRACGVINGYTDHTRLGADRWAALIAAHRRVEGPVCVLDCGTALTIDVLMADGRHLGGLIMPGLMMMRRALIEKTGVGETEEGFMPDNNVTLLASDTREAVLGGTLYALVAVIDRVIKDVSEAIEMELSRVITGGDAPLVLPLLAGDYRHEPDLILDGLAFLARQNE